MKRYWPFLFLTLISTTKPTPVSKGQDHGITDTIKPIAKKELPKEIKKIEMGNDSLNNVKKDLFKEAFKNQDLIAKKKPAKAVKIKTIPVPIPVTVYVQPQVIEEPVDTSLANDYLRSYDTVKEVKRGFIYRLFHKKHKQ